MRTGVLTETNEFKSGEPLRFRCTRVLMEGRHAGSLWKNRLHSFRGQKKARLAWNLAFNFAAFGAYFSNPDVRIDAPSARTATAFAASSDTTTLPRRPSPGCPRAHLAQHDATFMISAASVPASVIGVCGAPG